MRKNMIFTLRKFQNNSICIFGDFQQKVQSQRCSILIGKQCIYIYMHTYIYISQKQSSKNKTWIDPSYIAAVLISGIIYCVDDSSKGFWLYSNFQVISSLKSKNFCVCMGRMPPLGLFLISSLIIYLLIKLVFAIFVNYLLNVFRMPWQGQPDNLIDRFDVRAHLDIIPEYKPPAEVPK